MKSDLSAYTQGHHRHVQTEQPLPFHAAVSSLVFLSGPLVTLQLGN